MKKYFFLTLALVVLGSAKLSSQVTVGSSAKPNATLDVTTETDITNDNVTPVGVIAPRLTGEQIRKKTTGGAYTPAQTGDIVYATAADTAPSGPTAKITVEGYYYFDGTNWQQLSNNTSTIPSGTWLYCPPFDLKVSGTSVNLFQEYKDGLSGYTNSAGTLKTTTGNVAVPNLSASATDFDYLVRCSSSAISITSIDANGNMIYTVNSTTLGPDDFVSVVLIKK